MNAAAARRGIVRETFGRFGPLGVLLVLGALALMGPYGLLSWGENVAMLDKRESQIAALEAERDELQNLVERLNPDRVDPDLATELLRRKLNVAHPDDYLVELEKQR
ncbi:MAG TPA: septum formation initiator [Croceibacterium sp.]